MEPNELPGIIYKEVRLSLFIIFQHHMVQFLVFTGALFMCSLSLLMHVLNTELSIWKFSGLGYYKVIQTLKKEEKRRKTEGRGHLC